MKTGIISKALLAGLFLFANSELPGQDRITFDQLFSSELSPKGIGQIRWMKNDGAYSSLTGSAENQLLIKHNIVTESSDTLLRSIDLPVDDKPIDIDDYSFSEDETKLLLQTNTERLWRRSSKAEFWVYDLRTSEFRKLTTRAHKQSYASFSPDGRFVAYFAQNNLFLVNLENGEETQLTNDGALNEIINGAADWVYEEEFSFAKAFFWSPDSRYIAFYRFDERRVREFAMMNWDVPYPRLTKFKYPKAGEQNSIVSLGVYDLEDQQTSWMDLGENDDQYLVRVNWTQQKDMLSARIMNRLQNQQDLYFFNVDTGERSLIKTEKSEQWIEENDDLYFLPGGKEFLYVSEEDGYNHIYIYENSGKLKRQITSGNWDVTQVVGYNPKNKRLYYVSTEEGSIQRHFYSIRMNGKRKQKLSERKGWYSINMSPDFSTYIERFSSPEEPAVYTLKSGDAKSLRILESNEALKQKLASMELPKTKFGTIDGADGTPLNQYTIYPPDFDSTKTYPLLMFVYGGPGSQQVRSTFMGGQRNLWHQYLASEGYVVTCVDNRGTGGRGAAFKKQTYKKLGVLETEDQIHAAKKMAEKTYIDAQRIAIWGWSYGGYMSTFSLEKGSDVFAAAIAVAPVTDWRFYDTIYTERYMQTPQLNPEGYKNSAPLNFVEEIKGKYLLIHGTGDDNVHFQNSIEMNEALVQADIPFETMYYRNRSHGISGANTRRHLYSLMTRFLMEHL